MKIKFSFTDIMGIGISLILLITVLKNIRYDLLIVNFYELKAGIFVLSMVVLTLQTFLLAMRWQMLFEPEAGGRKVNGIPSYWLGIFYNSLLPGRMGDAVKVYHFSVRYAIDYKKVIAATIAEKIIDLQLIALMSSVYVLFFNIPLGITNYLIAGLAITIALADCICVLMMWNKKIRKIAFSLFPVTRMRIWVFQVFILIKHKLCFLYRARKILFFAEAGMFFIVLGIMGYYLVLKATGLQQFGNNLPVLIVLPIIMMVLHFIPSAPSSVGVLHYGIVKGLSLVAAAKGIDITPQLENQMIFASVILHLSYFIPETSIGFYFLMQERRLLFNKNN